MLLGGHMYLADVVPLVYLPRNVDQIFTYQVPLHLAPSVTTHAIVTIPFRRRSVLGVVVALKPHALPTPFVAKELRSLLPYPPLSPVQQLLARVLQDHYGAQKTLAYKTIIPTLLQHRPSPRRAIPDAPVPPSSFATRASPYTLPAATWEHLVEAEQGTNLTGRIFDPRDRVFTKYIAHRLKTAGTQVLILLPDIQSLALAAKTYRKRLRYAVVSWHSHLSRQEQSWAWQAVAGGQARIVLATRGGCFLPFRSLRTVLLFDESNDGYKSWDQQPYYDARYLIRLIARTVHIPLITTRLLPVLQPEGRPSVHLQPLPRPMVTVLDRHELRRAYGETAVIPEPVSAALADASAQEPALVFTNRLGYAGIVCHDCDYTVRCQQCEALLVYATADDVSARRMELRCSRCHKIAPAPTVCPVCHGVNLRFLGLGTERVEQELKRLLPKHRIVRVDARTIGAGSTRSSIVDLIHQNHPVITVASPFILSRLWALPRFATVVVLRAESLLMTPDWRVNERALITLELLRSASQHHFIIETNLPRHSVLHAVTTDRTVALMQRELNDRKRFGYPPYRRLVLLRPSRSGQAAHERRFFNELRKYTNLAATSGVARSGRYFVVRLAPTIPLGKLWVHLPSGWKVDVDPIALPA